MFYRAAGRQLAANAGLLLSRHLPATRPAVTRYLAQLSKSLPRTYATAARKTRSTAKRSTSSTRKSTKAKPKKKKPAKKTTATKKKKPAKKPVRKALTADQKLRKRVVALRQIALLSEPKRLPANSWLVFVADRKAKVGDPSTVSDYRNISAAEKEHYANIGKQNVQKNQQAYASWVKSHSVEEIKNANTARSSLRRIRSSAQKTGKKVPGATTGFLSIKDDRLLKRPLTPYFTFAAHQRASGAYGNASLAESSKAAGQQWKSMSASEKQQFQDRYEKELEQYMRDFASLYPNTKPPKSATRRS